MSALPPPSRLFVFLYPLVGVLFYLAICHKVESGQGFTVWLLVGLLSIVLTALIGSRVQSRPPWRILNPKKQSWAFMFGDPFLLGTMLWVSADAWSKGLIPSFARETWWQFTMTAVGVSAGLVMSTVDRRRYERCGALAAYEMLDKIFHDKVVVLVLFSTLLVNVVPLLWIWSVHAILALALLAGYVALLVIDEWRNVDPLWQYNLSPAA